MSIFIGNDSYKPMVGDQPIAKVFIGNDLVWSDEEPVQRETWQLRSNIPTAPFTSKSFNINFKTLRRDSRSRYMYKGILCVKSGHEPNYTYQIRYISENSSFSNPTVWTGESGWEDNLYRTITFLENISDDLREWLETFGTRIS